ncbi:TPA: hypothetical protein ACS28R_001573 [Klebsiella aerogenes]
MTTKFVALFSDNELDIWLLDVIYCSATHNSWNLAGNKNTQDGVIINLVIGSMFLVLPTSWLWAMTWAGI